jgi:hypothetical protein
MAPLHLDEWVAKARKCGAAPPATRGAARSRVQPYSHEQVKRCEALEEDELKALCEYVRWRGASRGSLANGR